MLLDWPEVERGKGGRNGGCRRRTGHRRAGAAERPRCLLNDKSETNCRRSGGGRRTGAARRGRQGSTPAVLMRFAATQSGGADQAATACWAFLIAALRRLLSRLAVLA